MHINILIRLLTNVFVPDAKIIFPFLCLSWMPISFKLISKATSSRNNTYLLFFRSSDISRVLWSLFCSLALISNNFRKISCISLMFPSSTVTQNIMSNWWDSPSFRGEEKKYIPHKNIWSLLQLVFNCLTSPYHR